MNQFFSLYDKFLYRIGSWKDAQGTLTSMHFTMWSKMPKAFFSHSKLTSYLWSTISALPSNSDNGPWKLLVDLSWFWNRSFSFPKTALNTSQKLGKMSRDTMVYPPCDIWRHCLVPPPPPGECHVLFKWTLGSSKVSPNFYFEEFLGRPQNIFWVWTNQMVSSRIVQHFYIANIIIFRPKENWISYTNDLFRNLEKNVTHERMIKFKRLKTLNFDYLSSFHCLWNLRWTGQLPLERIDAHVGDRCCDVVHF